jgi:beta-glucosidase/6-phospho-beta-glucosidase/beta-galactosidase
VDNFEWSEGYNLEFRFGLFGVDFDTQERIPRTSGELYARICQHNRISPQLVKEYDPGLLPQLFPEYEATNN